MPKHYPVNKAPASPEPAEPEDTPSGASQESAAAPSFWLLKDATAKKLGKRSEGTISYRLLADAERQHLIIAITGNANGGYFSRERVPFEKIHECLKRFSGKAFPSKALREAFFGRSSNNPGFLAAALSAESLIAGDAVDGQNKAIGDWSAWEAAMLALPGALLQADAAPALPEADDAMPDHTPAAIAEPKEVIPAKARKGAKQPKEAAHAGDTPGQ